ncbi:MAG: hypothetical protein JJ869_20625 [Marivita sp.]|uniref:hypothetical protein n=1 Tax=Marivita sp. TaxID=2003365 RepID=UPI001B21DA52|nr:hypothetical protein [Marivita sp.]MBO6885960.1 hypothetical protein [Marivita sp.]
MEYTLDSFRAPTTNAPYLVKEFLLALSAHKQIGLPLSSALHILDEAEQRLHGNPIVKGLLSIRLSNYLKVNRENVDEMERCFQVLGREINPGSYVIECFRQLKLAIPSNRKSDIEFLSRELVTTLLNMGVSSFFVNKAAVNYLFGNGSIKSADDLDGFLKIIFPHLHSFKVLVKIKSPIKVVSKEVLDIFKISLIKRIPKKMLASCPDSFKTLEKGQAYVLARK